MSSKQDPCIDGFSSCMAHEDASSKVLGIKEFHVAKALLEGQQEPGCTLDALAGCCWVSSSTKNRQAHFTVERWN